MAGPTSSADAGGGLEAENRTLCERVRQLEQDNEIVQRVTAYFVRDLLRE